MPHHPFEQIMQVPNVLGYVHCSESGDVLAQQGDEVDILANVLVYFQQVAGLIGESFGLEGFQEAQIQGKSLTVICVPHQGGAVGVVFNSRNRINENAALVHRALSNN